MATTAAKGSLSLIFRQTGVWGCGGLLAEPLTPTLELPVTLGRLLIRLSLMCMIPLGNIIPSSPCFRHLTEAFPVTGACQKGWDRGGEKGEKGV